MAAILSLLLVLMLSILVTRVATVALTHTGLSRQSARFQARSAFTGVGFTTTESEKVVNHPVRRRILMMLMLLGNAGIVTAMSSLILTFVAGGGTSMTVKIVLLVTGLVILWSVATSRWVDRRLSLLIDRALRRYSRLDVQDYASLLHLAGEYRVTEFQVQQNDWLADAALGELKLRDEGLLVLGIEREDGTYLGAPDGATRLYPGDTTVIYGRASTLVDLDERRRGKRGQAAHRRAVREQDAVHDREARDDPTNAPRKPDAL